jgi:CMP-N-acetylneuraminic acid synthetase
MNVLAVIPARMGSARVPWKNRLEIEAGVSLAQHAVDCARGSGVCRHIVVSTDAPEDLPIRNAQVSRRSIDLATGTADIAAVVQGVLTQAERTMGRFDYVVTLQPAVLARSPLIVRRLVEAVAAAGASGGLTMCPVHPWIWNERDGKACAPWLPGPYPRSQDCGPMWQEINAVQVSSAESVRVGRRWDFPLVILDLPTWAAALDVDTPADLATARDMWPWCKSRLETWTGATRCLAC